jgi:uncharacterized membrane protein YedE/YeeE
MIDLIDLMPEPWIAAIIGAFGGLLLGLSARLGRFCSLGAIEDAMYGGQGKRLAQWGIALGVAILGTGSLAGAGLFDTSRSFYLSEPFSPVVVLTGALIFGYGMALAGTCGFGALARAGGGDIRAMVIALVLGIFALITVSGPLAPLRVAAVDATLVRLPEGGLPGGAALLGISPLVVFALAGLTFLVLGLASSELRQDKAALFWGAAAGVAIVSAWAGTAWLARVGFEELPVISHTFSAPPGDTLLYLMTASGGGLGFGVGSVAGVILGATLGSLIKGQFRWEACEDPRELRRQITGAALMGVGAVLALGCTIGQGLSAMSVLAWSAPLAALGIIIGAVAGLRQLVEGRILPR